MRIFRPPVEGLRQDTASRSHSGGWAGNPLGGWRQGTPGAGPLAGVLAGLDWAAQSGADRIVTVAADTPFFPRDLVARLERAAEGMPHPLVLAATPDGRQPTFGLWPVALRDDLRDALRGGLRKVVMWTDRHGGREALFDAAGDPFFNVNTPEDLARAREMAGGAT